jgi:NAD(P)-dependent dehydrogenase (short-subunit alcohol dehydrogenase family)
VSAGVRFVEALREVAGVAAYPAIGHRLRRGGWAAADLEVDLRGRVCVVTGASAGLGLAVARGLGERGATVVMVCRDPGRGAAARREVEAAGGRPELELADVASVAAVRALAGRIADRHRRVDVLVNNAGVSLWERRASADGVEMTFATNVLGGFLLTHLLQPALARAAPARVVHMTSAAAYGQRLDVDAMLERDGRAYQGAIQYARTKRAQIELNALWVDRLDDVGVTSRCVHPGLTATPGTAQSVPLYHRVFGPILRDPAQGADTALWLSASPAALGRAGELWFDRAPRPLHLVPWTRSPRAEAERLWAACAALGGVEPGEPRR